MKLLSLKIDVTKINKDRLYKGTKGTYLNLSVALNDEKDTYGNDVSVWEEQTKEERENKQERNYLGNGKTVWEGEKKTVKNDSPIDNSEDDLPF